MQTGSTYPRNSNPTAPSASAAHLSSADRTAPNSSRVQIGDSPISPPSPRVALTICSRAPLCASIASVPPAISVSSSGCAPIARMLVVMMFYCASHQDHLQRCGVEHEPERTSLAGLKDVGRVLEHGGGRRK